MLTIDTAVNWCVVEVVAQPLSEMDTLFQRCAVWFWFWISDVLFCLQRTKVGELF